MNKIIYSGDQDELLKALDGHTSTFYDSNQSVKSASSSAMSREMMQQHLPDDKHFAVHYVALGAGELFGPNRNGDDWPEAGLAHKEGSYGTHTFTQGHYFREHRNRDPKKAIGIIKAAAYNPDMKRSEVIVWGDKRKAEKEYEEAKAGKALDCSMSARVPGDECSCCGNFAKSSRVYCEHLRNHMTQWIPKFQKFAYAINHQPNFFDLSAVENKADRIASHLEIAFSPGETKSASFQGFKFSDEQATEAGIMLPDSLPLGCLKPEHQRWLTKCAAVEKQLRESTAYNINVQFVKEASTFAFADAVTEAQLSAMRELEPDVLFAFMCKRAAVLPFQAFVSYVSNKSLSDVSDNTDYKQACTKLPELFSFTAGAVSNGETEILVTPAINVKLAAHAPDYATEKTLKEVCRNNSLVMHEVKQRMFENCVNEKRASVVNNDNTIIPELSSQAKNWLQAYGLYKVASVNAIVENYGQDIVDDTLILLLNSTNVTN